MHTTEEHRFKNATNKGAATLFVGLYLVILAFFIWLNSVAEIDKDRTSKALSSLHHTFSKQQGGMAKLDAVMPKVLTYEMVVEDYFGAISDTTRNAFPLEDIGISRRGDHMRLIIPSYRFFKPNSANMRRGQKNYLPNLVRILSRNLMETSVEVKVSLRSQPLSYSLLNQTEIARVGYITSELVAHGLPPYLVTGGILPGKRESIIMDFTVGFDRVLPQQNKVVLK